MQTPTIIAEFEKNNGVVTIIKKDNGLYDVIENDVVVQPDHNSEGIIRYLSHCLHNAYYLLEKNKNKS